MFMQQPVDLHQYRADHRAGKYANPSRRDKIEMFGTTTMPIFVPLAPGETMDEYEDRFRDWLRRRGDDLDELRKEYYYEERAKRISFANANADGVERYEEWEGRYKRSRSRAERSRSPSKSRSSRSRSRSRSRSKSRDTKRYDEGESTKRRRGEEAETRERKPEAKKEATTSGSREQKPDTSDSPTASGVQRPSACVIKNPLSGASPAVAITAHLDCGCSPCLFAAMGLMDERLQEIDSKARTTKTSRGVVDLTLDDDAQSPRIALRS